MSNKIDRVKSPITFADISLIQKIEAEIKHWVSEHNINAIKQIMKPIFKTSIPYSECIWEVKRL